MDTAFKKDTAGLRDGNGLICIKAILKYRHGSKNEEWRNNVRRPKGKPMAAACVESKLSRELAQASRNHEVPWIISMRSLAVSFLKKAVDLRAK